MNPTKLGVVEVFVLKTCDEEDVGNMPMKKFNELIEGITSAKKVLLNVEAEGDYDDKRWKIISVCGMKFVFYPTATGTMDIIIKTELYEPDDGVKSLGDKKISEEEAIEDLLEGGWVLDKIMEIAKEHAVKLKNTMSLLIEELAAIKI